MDIEEDLKALRKYLSACGEFNRERIVGDGLKEIERLRAGQFRWIPVGERLPKVECQHFGIKYDGLCVWWGKENHHVPYGVTHWADVPPLPEATQEEKDEEIWKRYINAGPNFDDLSYKEAKFVFMCGLKAARGQK